MTTREETVKKRLEVYSAQTRPSSTTIPAGPPRTPPTRQSTAPSAALAAWRKLPHVPWPPWPTGAIGLRASPQPSATPPHAGALAFSETGACAPATPASTTRPYRIQSWNSGNAAFAPGKARTLPVGTGSSGAQPDPACCARSTRLQRMVQGSVAVAATTRPWIPSRASASTVDPLAPT